MASRPRSRSRGQKDPAGKTKSAIVLYLADSGERSFSDIREYLVETFNIRNTKNIRTHLRELEEVGLIARTSHGKGNADTFLIDRSFNNLRKAFNYFSRPDDKAGFLKSAYSTGFTASGEFRNKVIISMIRTCILQVDKFVHNEGAQAETAGIIADLPPECRDVVVRWIDRVRNGNSPDLYRKNFLEMIARYDLDDIDALHDMFFKLLKEYRTRYPLYGSEDYRIMISELIVPDGYKDRFFGMIRLSPSAFDYVINSMYSDAMHSSRRLMGYFLSFLALFPEMYDFSIEEHSDLGYLSEIDSGLRTEFINSLAEFKGEPATYLMVKSLFVSDMVFNRLAGEVPEDIGQEICQ